MSSDDFEAREAARDRLRPDQLNLGEVIEALEAEDPARRLPLGFHQPHSFRQYYDDLAFEPAENIAVGEMLAAARSALGATMTGYKGGDYVMDVLSPCWLAYYGESGETLGRTLLRLMLAAPAAAEEPPRDR